MKTRIHRGRTKAKRHPMVKRQELKQSLAKSLTKQEKLLLTLYYVENLDAAEIAAVLGISKEKVLQKWNVILARVNHRKDIVAELELCKN